MDPSLIETDPQLPRKKVQPSQSTTKENGKLKEFMAVMQPKKGPAWANEEVCTRPSLTQESGVHEEAPQEPLSDLEWMRKRMSNFVDQEDKVFEQSDEEVQDNNHVCLCIFPVHNFDLFQPGTQVIESAPAINVIKETILQTSRLFVRNLAFSCTEEELDDLFRPFGEIVEVSFYNFTVSDCKYRQR